MSKVALDRKGSSVQAMADAKLRYMYDFTTRESQKIQMLLERTEHFKKQSQ